MPELPVIGISHIESKATLEQLFREDIQFEYCLLLEAELLKSALNSLLALSITFGNEISEICDQLEVSGNVVMSLLKLEPRIGKSLPLLPGLPFSGGTLGRDVQNLRKLSSRKTSLVDAIWQSNFDRKDYFINVVAKIADSSGENSVGLLGLTYKTGTSTLRRSFPLQCGQSLTRMGFRVYGFDPMAKSFDEEINESLDLCDSVEEIFNHCNILVITTPWNEIIRRFSIDLVKNKTIIDPFGVLSEELIQACTYKHFGGRM
jgi:UDPglucose 6-dehydrogenase